MMRIKCFAHKLFSVFFLLLSLNCASSFAAEISIITTEGKHTYSVEIADSPDKWLTGLREKNDLAYNEGMLFLFPYEDIRAFTTTGMKFSIDIIYFDSSFNIIGIFQNVPPGEKILIFPKPAFGVFERKFLKGSPEIKPGDRLKIINLYYRPVK